MRNRLLSLVGSLLGVGILLVVSSPTSAHGGQAQEQARPVPRQPDGKPDLSGIWARIAGNRYFTSWVVCDDRIRTMYATDVCEITGAWEFEAYCHRREQGLPMDDLFNNRGGANGPRD